MCLRNIVRDENSKVERELFDSLYLNNLLNKFLKFWQVNAKYWHLESFNHRLMYWRWEGFYGESRGVSFWRLGPWDCQRNCYPQRLWDLIGEWETSRRSLSFRQRWDWNEIVYVHTKTFVPQIDFSNLPSIVNRRQFGVVNYSTLCPRGSTRVGACMNFLLVDWIQILELIRDFHSSVCESEKQSFGSPKTNFVSSVPSIILLCVLMISSQSLRWRSALSNWRSLLLSSAWRAIRSAWSDT